MTLQHYADERDARNYGSLRLGARRTRVGVRNRYLYALVTTTDTRDSSYRVCFT